MSVLVSQMQRLKHRGQKSQLPSWQGTEAGFEPMLLNSRWLHAGPVGLKGVGEGILIPKAHLVVAVGGVTRTPQVEIKGVPESPTAKGHPPVGLILMKLSEASLVPSKMWLRGVEDLTSVDEVLGLVVQCLALSRPCQVIL